MKTVRVVFGQLLMQPGPDFVGGVGTPLALVAYDQSATGDHAGDTGQADPLPNAAHS